MYFVINSEVCKEIEASVVIFILFLQLNNHRLSLVMSPDKDYNSKAALVEESNLRQKTEKLSTQDRERIFKQVGVVIDNICKDPCWNDLCVLKSIKDFFAYSMLADLIPEICGNEKLVNIIDKATKHVVSEWVGQQISNK